jgi:hypothetical protein
MKRPSCSIALSAVCFAVATACATRTAPIAPEPYADMAQYHRARAELIERERGRRLGASLMLTPEEESEAPDAKAFDEAIDRSITGGAGLTAPWSCGGRRL